MDLHPARPQAPPAAPPGSPGHPLIRVHTADGLTATFDLANAQQAGTLAARVRDRRWHSTVTAITAARVRGAGVGSPEVSLVRPSGFSSVLFEAWDVPPQGHGKGGEQVVLIADEVRLVLMLHRDHGAARIALSKPGRQRYNPNVD